jgi:sugar phosphate isomerase/epimerase
MKFGITASTFATEQRPATFGDGQITKHLQGIKDLGYHGVDLFIRPMEEKDLWTLRAALVEGGLEVSVISRIRTRRNEMTLFACIRVRSKRPPHWTPILF